MSVIDLQKVAASLYDTVINMNSSATQMIGLDAIYCRLLPYENSEDVIIQEYTLHNYECPKNIKVVTGNSSYQAGNFAIDLFGIKASESLSISIDVATWESVYGKNTMPQKGDFILIPTLYRPFEVASTSPVHTIGELITSWNCQLTEWKHKASRKESEDFTASIDDLTVSQDRLFGDAISKEVADSVIEVETAYQTTTYVDPIKEVDLDCITINELRGEHGNIISNAYYAFKNATKNNTYKHINATVDPSEKENHWIYSCWIKANNETIKTSSVKIDKQLYLKDKNYWWFAITPNMEVAEGDEVTIYRGGMIKLFGIIESKECESGWTLKVPASDCLAASKKVANFWTAGIWKMQKYMPFNLFSGYNNDEKIFNIKLDNSAIIFNINDISLRMEIKQPKIDFTRWSYIAIDFSKSYIRVVIDQLVDSADGSVISEVLCDQTENINIKTFSFEDAAIENAGNNIDMCNIRLYENEYELGENYKLDMYSEVTRNASKLILVDNPNPANKMSFKTKVR